MINILHAGERFFINDTFAFIKSGALEVYGVGGTRRVFLGGEVYADNTTFHYT